MKRELVSKSLIRSFWFSPWATKLPDAAVCAVSPFQLPFPGNNGLSFQTRNVRMGEAKLWVGDGRSCLGGLGWVTDRMLRRSGRRALQTCSWRSLSLEGTWKAAREKTQIHSPSNWLFSCISETHSLVGLTAIVSFGGWSGGVRWKLRKFGAKMRSRGTGGKPSSSQSLLFRYLQETPFFFFNPVWDGQWCKVDPDKKEKLQPLMNGWRRRKN